MIYKHKETTIQLLKAKEQPKESDRLKSTFLPTSVLRSSNEWYSRGFFADLLKLD
jgi:hypothetical protein